MLKVHEKIDNIRSKYQKDIVNLKKRPEEKGNVRLKGQEKE